ncbi:conserved hypothetical protein [Ricinus communis]|uniref:Uncharacterized protein n=1 Tax=Ricinus communis TaxID=3988 RepID=B9TBG5_RICCO|nr:conserved hypothetical protein [Ricinus communis]
MPVPEGVDSVLYFEALLKLREAGKKFDWPLAADEKGVDWLDVLLKQGLEGFPAHWRRWSPELDRQAA